MKLKTIWAILFGRFDYISYVDHNDSTTKTDLKRHITFYFCGNHVKFWRNSFIVEKEERCEVTKDVDNLVELSGIFSVGKSELTIPIIRNKDRIRFPRIKFLLGMLRPSPTLRASSTIVHMKSILNRNETLMKDCLSEIKMLKADMKLYAEAGLEQQYRQTHDILLANKAMLEQQVQIIEMAIMKAEVTHKEIQLQTKFLDTLKAREDRIRSLASKTLMLHSETASTMQLIENKVGDIDTLKRLCSGVISLNDHAQIGIIHDTLKETERDFSNVFSKKNFELLVS